MNRGGVRPDFREAASESALVKQKTGLAPNLSSHPCASCSVWHRTDAIRVGRLIDFDGKNE